MSFLYPLFLAGIAAIGLPILVHMVRNRTRKRLTFSSLMFVPVTMPRFRDRSRIENVLLLILRCAVLCLLAFAFARPFLRRPIAENPTGVAKRLVLLIDTSASMRRAGMWEQAVREARSVLGDAGPADRVCTMSFDQDTRIITGFEQWASLDLTRRAAVAAEQLADLSPGWASTNLGHALIAAAEAIEDDEVNDSQNAARIAARQVVLVSDLQQGSNLDVLHTYEWPKGTELVVKQVRNKAATNASLQLVTDRGNVAGDDRIGVRVVNSPDATAERFQLKWADQPTQGTSSEAIDVYVPPGRSVVVHMPQAANQPAWRKLILTGDDHDFDNILYVAPHLQRQVNVLYIGDDDPNDPKQMLYYARRAFEAAGNLKSHVVSRSGTDRLPAEEIGAAHFVIVAGAVAGENIPALRRHIESGRTLLLVVSSPDAVASLAHLAGIDNLQSEDASLDSVSGRGYAMLNRVEFKHPLLTPFSDPRFGDFSRIHFWKYRRLNVADCPGARVLAWFDTGDAAWFEMPVGKGTLLVFAGGWHPSDSDLALSSKFVPLLYSILEYAGVLEKEQSQYFVGDPVPIPDLAQSKVADLQIRRPDDSLVRLNVEQASAVSAAAQTFSQTDMPGIYTVESSAGSWLFPVNLPAKECRTAPMSLDELESLGVTSKSAQARLGGAAIERMEKARQHSGLAQMESEQKIWRWVLVAMLIVLLIEIWLAGWTSASSVEPTSAKSLDPARDGPLDTARDGSVEPQTSATAVSHGERQ